MESFGGSFEGLTPKLRRGHERDSEGRERVSVCV